MRELRFPTATALVDTLAADLVVQLRDSLADHAAASLVVPGGRTPTPLFQRLARADLPWHRITIALGDERWVEPTEAASNERLVRSELLQARAAAARFVGLKNAAASPAAGATASFQGLAGVPRPFSSVVLGMGEDGHFASLFPGAEGLAAALDPTAPPACVAMTAPTAPAERMSLNLAALLEARRIVLLLTGATKWRVYERAREAGSTLELPVRALLTQRSVPVTVYFAPTTTDGSR